MSGNILDGMMVFIAISYYEVFAWLAGLLVVIAFFVVFTRMISAIQFANEGG